ncbi:hypothetical protein [Candidatus Uabimicrobium sp. HlEnr_7]|uniref:hypothetical protein n=1 Tax=Candidatus Uabimicrobium helgolandensis TaxID=3095367 RepID=UPI003555E711
MDSFKIEMMITIYSIVIGFSFSIFREEKLRSFSFAVGLASILCLAGRLLSMQSQFVLAEHNYTEVFFFLDIFIMVAFYRSLTTLRNINQGETTEEIEGYKQFWLWFTFTMFLTMLYRLIYSQMAIEWAIAGQLSAIAFCFGGFILAKVMVKKQVQISTVRKGQFVYSVLLLIGSIAYCAVRFTYTNL